MSFWRKEVIDFALDRETRRQMEEQRAWIQREPSNPQPYYHLAQFYRMAANRTKPWVCCSKRCAWMPASRRRMPLWPKCTSRGDYPAAWRHARLAEANGVPRVVEMLVRNRVTPT